MRSDVRMIFSDGDRTWVTTPRLPVHGVYYIVNGPTPDGWPHPEDASLDSNHPEVGELLIDKVLDPLVELGVLRFDQLETTEQWCARVEASMRRMMKDKDGNMVPGFPPDMLLVSIVTPDKIPTDRTFRDALKPDLTHDIEKAREIAKDKVREARKPLLAELDVEMQRTVEIADAAARVAKMESIVARKQVLRDATKHPSIVEATTCDDLKLTIKEVLEKV